MNGTGRLLGGFYRSLARLGRSVLAPHLRTVRLGSSRVAPAVLSVEFFSCEDIHVFRDGFFDFARRGCSLFPVTVFLAAPARLCPFGGRSTFFGAFFAAPVRTAGRFEPDCCPVIPFPRALVFTEGPVPAPAGPSRLTLRLSPLPSALAIALTPEIGFAQRGAERMPSFAHCAESSIALIPHD